MRVHKTLLLALAACAALCGCGGEASQDNLCPGGGEAVFTSSSYDQSCETDQDCVLVPEGDVCAVCSHACPRGVINSKAKARYLDDIEVATHSSSSDDVCRCPRAFVACCLSATCHADASCMPPAP